MTNREWLNKLSDKELAGELHGCKHCAYIGEFCCERPEYKNCVDGITEWLNAEHIEPMPELQVGDVLTSNTNQTFIVVHKDYAYDVSEERIDSLNYVLSVYAIVDVSRFDINGKCQLIWRADNE